MSDTAKMTDMASLAEDSVQQSGRAFQKAGDIAGEAAKRASDTLAFNVETISNTQGRNPCRRQIRN